MHPHLPNPALVFLQVVDWNLPNCSWKRVRGREGRVGEGDARLKHTQGHWAPFPLPLVRRRALPSPGSQACRGGCAELGREGCSALSGTPHPTLSLVTLSHPEPSERERQRDRESERERALRRVCLCQGRSFGNTCLQATEGRMPTARH